MTDEEMDVNIELLDPLANRIAADEPDVKYPWIEASRRLFPDFWKTDDEIPLQQAD